MKNKKDENMEPWEIINKMLKDNFERNNKKCVDCGSIENVNEELRKCDECLNSINAGEICEDENIQGSENKIQ